MNNRPLISKPKVVVIGGSFGGLSLVRHLKSKFDVTCNNYLILYNYISKLQII